MGYTALKDSGGSGGYRPHALSNARGILMARYYFSPHSDDLVDEQTLQLSLRAWRVLRLGTSADLRVNTVN